MEVATDLAPLWRRALPLILVFAAGLFVGVLL